MSYIDEVIAEFDEQTRVLHLTARSQIRANTLTELNELCSAVRSVLESFCTSDRCYMIVDLSKFAIDTTLSDKYMEKIGCIQKDFIYENGLVRYGYEITRVTIKMGHARHAGSDDPHLFASKSAACNYVNDLISQRARITAESAP